MMLPAAAFSQLPTPTYGWNMGNTLEPPCGEGCWGPAATEALINAVADAGFNTVRIPCAWNSHASQTSPYTIDPAYMARVKQVVDWCLARNLYVIINCHWDGGWLENNITGTVDPIINAKQNSYWTQIANAFAGYDDRVMFAGTNEPNADTAAEMATLLTYHQTFVDAVRAMGGNNSTRWLVVQGPNTDIDLTYNLMNTLPTDPATPDRLMVEVHYYSPWNFCGLTQDESWGNMFYFWGQDYHHPTMTIRNANWGEESYLVAQFEKMRTKFVNQGITVIMGEFSAMKRTGNPELAGADLDLHLASRTFFHKLIVDTANSKGLKPCYWDTSSAGMFNWPTGAEIDPANINALTGGAALPPPGGGGGGAALREWWTGISGTAISQLTSNPNFPDNPTGRQLISSLEGPTNWADNYGTRIRGFVQPPESGNYTFWIAGDDYSELYLSTDEDPANSVLIAQVSGWTNSREWGKYPQQQSSLISLAAGQKYYIEVLHKEGTGGDNIAVAWEGPGITQQVINGMYLSACCLDFGDFADFGLQWGRSDCGAVNNWCSGFDIDRDGYVLLDDLKAFADAWLAGI
jgi:aryl-phospho-beta-D-glucosidase BglC (GH1 family)